MIIMLYWTFFIYITAYYSGVFSSCKDKNNNGQKRTQRISTY
ncbi:Uncharacterised protein [Klebsiella pneumoniae]|nr:hypothetical protein HMPREF1305_00892 [Klebsiella pneumoniae subsp. pneumoniae WGLW1]EKB80646.1 hypothetical protein HMPREF1307_01066 [Klebsiella pneumoniae subsp. pneumoniae WGLW3]STU60901.1 Uncharacterised protein [Klebsiella pneumoniae]SWO80645.1 Uncharacterised protein [Klebsiella pneumoniae]SYS17206.1 Uncharacterised protein [Klebsiella pneumoniae]